MYFHWIINPGLAFNELVLGQRIPKITLVDTTSNASLPDKSFVPCPHCNTHHDSRIWSAKNGLAFKNWFGYFCPTCHKVIPCLINATTWLILAITSPIWFWFKDYLFKKWLEKQPRRYEDAKPQPYVFERKEMIGTGIAFGSFMFLFNCILMFLIEEQKFTFFYISISVVISLFAGILFSLLLKFFLKGKTKTSA